MSKNALRIALVAASVAAVIVVLDLFSAGFRVVCLGIIAAVALASFPMRRMTGGGWWWLLAGGAALSIGGAIIAQPAPDLGGWIALIGGLAVPIAAAIGFPGAAED